MKMSALRRHALGRLFRFGCWHELTKAATAAGELTMASSYRDRTHDAPVLIAGGGPVGLTMALLPGEARDRFHADRAPAASGKPLRQSSC